MRKSHFRGALIALAICAATPTTAWGQDSAAMTAGEASETKLDLAREIIALGYPEETREQMFFTAMDQTAGQVRQSVLSSMDIGDAGAIAVLDTWLAERQAASKDLLRQHLPAIMEAIAIAHADTFGEQELRDIHAFVATPSGQGYFAKSSSLLSHPAYASANQAYLDESFANLQEEMGVLMQRLQEYSEQSDGQ